MALQDKLKKIEDTTGLFLKDTHKIFDTKTVTFNTKSNKRTKNYPIIEFGIQLKHNNKRTIQPFLCEHMTLNRAIELAKAKRIELNQQFKQGILNTNKNKVIQLDTLWTEYVELKKIEFKQSHIYSMDKIYHKWIGAKFGKSDITKITNTDLQSIINKMLKSINPHTKRPYAPRTTEHIKNW